MNAIERLCGRIICLEKGHLTGSYENVRTGILAYLNDVGYAATGSVWVNSGKEYQNDYFVPQRLEISSLGAPEEFNGIFSNNRPMQILISGSVLRTDPAQIVGIALYDENDELLFQSFSSDGEEERWPEIGVGPIILRVLIPQHFLNEGNYRVELLAALHYRAWLLEPRKNVPSVTFSIQGGLSKSPYWDHKRNGVLAPVLNWERCHTSRPGQSAAVPLGVVR
jgi:lipopolysaccharide transport system ATP-binding protein